MGSSGQPNPRVPEVVQRGIFERDQYTCRGCNQKLLCVLDISPRERNVERRVLYLVCDHIDGPSIADANLQALCWKCNSAKAGRGQNSFRLSMALKQLGPCMTYYPSIAGVIGLKESIFLCQLAYWTPRGRHDRGDGWIYKSVEDMLYETGLSYKEQTRVRDNLLDQGLIQEHNDRAEHRLYFRVVPEKLDELGCSMGRHITDGHMPQEHMPSAERADGTLPEVSSIKGNIDYTKTTSKKSTGKPTIEEVRVYCAERKNGVDVDKWFDHYSSNGWMVGRVPMKDWKAAVRTWERNGFEKGNGNGKSKSTGAVHDTRQNLERYTKGADFVFD